MLQTMESPRPTKRPLTVSLPLGLFGSAMMSVPPDLRELPSRELLDMPIVAPETDEPDDDILLADEPA